MRRSSLWNWEEFLIAKRINFAIKSLELLISISSGQTVATFTGISLFLLHFYGTKKKCHVNFVVLFVDKFYFFILLFNLFESENWATSSSALCFFSFLNKMFSRFAKKSWNVSFPIDVELCSRLPELLQSAPNFQNFSLLLFSCILITAVFDVRLDQCFIHFGLATYSSSGCCPWKLTHGANRKFKCFSISYI